MAISEHIGQDGQLYLRIRRAWGGQERQRYLRLKRPESRVWQEARAIDRRFKEAQEAYQLRLSLPMNSVISAKGHIVGVTIQLTKRYGKAYPEFKIRVRNPGEQKIHYSSVSVMEHGLKGAFLIAIQKVMQWRGIDQGTETVKRMHRTFEQYESQFLELAYNNKGLLPDPVKQLCQRYGQAH